MPTIKFTDKGNRFDYEKTTKLGPAYKWSPNDTRGSHLHKTASGNYIIENWSRWQGEGTDWVETSREEAKNIALKFWDWSEAVAEFPELEKEYDDTY